MRVVFSVTPICRKDTINHEESLRLLDIAIEQYYPSAYFALGEHYYYGLGKTPKNNIEAVKYFYLAFQEGNRMYTENPRKIKKEARKRALEIENKIAVSTYVIGIDDYTHGNRVTSVDNSDYKTHKDGTKYSIAMNDEYTFKKRHEISFEGCVSGTLSREITISRSISLTDSELESIGIGGSLGNGFIASINTEVLDQLSSTEKQKLESEEKFTVTIEAKCKNGLLETCYIEDKMKSGDLTIIAATGRSLEKDLHIPVSSKLVCSTAEG